MFSKISKFVDEVKQEVSKVVWPSKRETISSSVMLMIMSVFVALVFFLVDKFFIWVMSFVFNL